MASRRTHAAAGIRVGAATNDSERRSQEEAYDNGWYRHDEREGGEAA
jgi:hypothetical protein